MTRRRTKGLSAADKALWEQVARSVSRADQPETRPLPAPLSPEPRAFDEPLPLPPVPRQPAEALRVLRPEARSPARPWAVHHAPSMFDGLDPAAGLDKNTARRVRTGKRAPQARIDLHGMTSDRAHAALSAFIRRSHAQGLRFVLVITGKGGRRREPEDAPFVPEGHGVLRHAAPRWLREPALARYVTGVYEAHHTHGGGGALYVQLSKRR